MGRLLTSNGAPATPCATMHAARHSFKCVHIVLTSTLLLAAGTGERGMVLRIAEAMKLQLVNHVLVSVRPCRPTVQCSTQVRESQSRVQRM